MKDDVCAAHSLLVADVHYIRKKQDATSETVTEMSVTMKSIQDTQSQILKMVQRRKWTPARVIALSAVLFGSGSAFPMLIAMFVKVAGK